MKTEWNRMKKRDDSWNVKIRQSCDTWSQLESTDRCTLKSKHVRSQSLERSGSLTMATCRTCDPNFGDRETPSRSSTVMSPWSEFWTSNRIVWNQESGAERSAEKSWFRWSCRVQSAKDFSTNTGDLPYNQAASQQVTGTRGLSMLNLHFCVHFLILRASWNFFDPNGLEWLQFKTPQQLQARSHLKPLVALEPWHQPWRLHVHFPSLLSVLIVIERLYPLHGLQLCHSTLKTGYLTIKSFFHKSSSSGLAVPHPLTIYLLVAGHLWSERNLLDTCIQL